MPNWVFNTINNYTEDLYNKYSNEEGNYAIDFDKVIPEPEEITNTVSGSMNDTAKAVYKYTNYINEAEAKGETLNLRWDNNNPLRDRVKREAENTTMAMGELAIENPDDSLHEILDKESTPNYKKQQYDRYVKIFGNNSLDHIKDYKQMYDNYVKVEEEDFDNYKNKDSKFDKYHYQDKESLYDVGKYLTELQEKYGYDNWYDWRIANWGTKWNACESDYDKDGECMRFNTAWSIPYPIITKIAKDNPDAKLDGYSEEETGWFDEYTSDNGKIYINARGEMEYSEEDDKYIENREEVNPPEELYYDDVAKKEKEDWDRFLVGKFLI